MRELNPDFVDLEISNTYFISSGFEDGYRGWAEGGFEEALRTWFEVATQIEGIFPVYVACNYAKLRNTDEAIALLERGYQQRDPMMILLKFHSQLDPIRSDPCFHDMLGRIGFPGS